MKALSSSRPWTEPGHEDLVYRTEIPLSMGLIRFGLAKKIDFTAEDVR